MTSPLPFDLGRPWEPWVLFARRDVGLVDTGLSAFAAGGGRIHRFRAEELRDERAVFEQFAARLGFPSYFGWNWDAMVDCLGDLCGAVSGSAGVACVIDGADVLLDAPFLRVLVSVLCQGAARAGAIADLDGDPLDRPATAQHHLFVLDGHPTESLAAKLQHPDLVVAPTDDVLTVTLNPEVWFS